MNMGVEESFLNMRVARKMLSLSQLGIMKTFLRRYTFVGIGSCLLMTVAPARGGLLADYQFTLQSAASFDSELQSVASPIARGSGFSPTTLTLDVPGSPGSALGAYAQGTGGNNLSGAVTDNDFFSFTVTPSVGYNLDFSGQSITFDASINNTQLNGGYAIQSSVGGFGASSPVLGTATVTSTTWLGQTISFPSLASYNDLSSLELRFYIFDFNSGMSRYMAFDNIQLNGFVTPVPEPYEYGLIAVFGLMAFGLLENRRSRKRLTAA
jgi:hypothetical protein